MQQDGIMKVLAGITSFDELARVVDLYYRNTPDEKQLESGESAESVVSEHTI
jgi:hypothetical protein